MTQTETGSDQAAAEAWKAVITKAMANAITGLSGMLGQPIKVTSLGSRRIPVGEMPDLVGGREAMTAGVYIGVENGPSGSGHMIIVYPPRTAYDLIDMLMDNPPGSTQELAEMEQSVLGEVGNVMGSQFLNTLSNYTGLDLRVTPPAVMMDMAGSILDAALAEMMTDGDDALVMDTTFGTEDRQINGKFLVMPSLILQGSLIEKLIS